MPIPVLTPGTGALHRVGQHSRERSLGPSNRNVEGLSGKGAAIRRG